jgi:hypothetical protein
MCRSFIVNGIFHENTHEQQWFPLCREASYGKHVKRQFQVKRHKQHQKLVYNWLYNP